VISSGMQRGVEGDKRCVKVDAVGVECFVSLAQASADFEKLPFQKI